jgi:hypothetical protein
VGVSVSIGVGPVEGFTIEHVSITFSIKETEQVFSAGYTNVVGERGGISLSGSAYYTSLEATKSFPAETDLENIARDYAGTSTSVSVNVGPFTMGGSEGNGWTTKTVNVGLGIGAGLATGELVETKYVEGSFKQIR